MSAEITTPARVESVSFCFEEKPLHLHRTFLFPQTFAFFQRNSWIYNFAFLAIEGEDRDAASTQLGCIRSNPYVCDGRKKKEKKKRKKEEEEETDGLNHTYTQSVDAHGMARAACKVRHSVYTEYKHGVW